MTGDEKWILYDNPKRRKSWAKLNIHVSKLLFSIWWDQLGIVYYELLKPTETIIEDRHRLAFQLNIEVKRPLYEQRHYKMILQYDNAWPHVAKRAKMYLETFKGGVLPYSPSSPDNVRSDYHLFRSMPHSLAEQHFYSYEDTRKSVDSWLASKDVSFFRCGIQMLTEK